jgi:hypothetical protein
MASVVGPARLTAIETPGADSGAAVCGVAVPLIPTDDSDAAVDVPAVGRSVPFRIGPASLAVVPIDALSSSTPLALPTAPASLTGPTIAVAGVAATQTSRSNRITRETCARIGRWFGVAE